MIVWIRDIVRSYIRFGVVIHFYKDDIDSSEIWSEAFSLICEQNNDFTHLKGKVSNPDWFECEVKNQDLNEKILMLQLQGKKMIYLTDETLIEYGIDVIKTEDGKYIL